MKKRRLIICVVCIVCLALIIGISACVIVSNRTEPEKDYKIAVIGDSIAYGYGLEENQRFSSILQNKFTQVSENMGNHFEVVNSSTNGITTEQLIEKIEKDEGYKKALDKADVVCISIGGNDLLHFLTKFMKDSLQSQSIEQTAGLMATKNGQEKLINVASSGDFMKSLNAVIASYANNLSKIFSDLKDINPDVKIYIQTIYNPLGVDCIYQQFDKFYTYINQPIIDLAANNGCEVVDVYNAFHDEQDRSSVIGVSADPKGFPTHPTEKGHQIIADQYYQSFDKMLNNKLALTDEILRAKEIEQGPYNDSLKKSLNKEIDKAVKVDKNKRSSAKKIDKAKHDLTDKLKSLESSDK